MQERNRKANRETETLQHCRRRETKTEQTFQNKLKIISILPEVGLVCVWGEMFKVSMSRYSTCICPGTQAALAFSPSGGFRPAQKAAWGVIRE